MSIQALIFDLDDTLYDCGVIMAKRANRAAAEAMIKVGLDADPEELFNLRMKYFDSGKRLKEVNALVAEHYNASKEMTEAARRGYLGIDVSDLKPFPDAFEVLETLVTDGYRLALVTSGDYGLQSRKIKALGIEKYFSFLIISMQDKKITALKLASERLGVHYSQIICVGDRPDSEIRYAKMLGMVTVRALMGKYHCLLVKGLEEEADFQIYSLKELLTILSKYQ